MTSAHVPVMVQEVLDLLNVQSGGIYVDATLGMGGHAEAILKSSAPTGRVIGLDRDAEALTAAQERLRTYRERVLLVRSNFSDITTVLSHRGLGPRTPEITAALGPAKPDPRAHQVGSMQSQHASMVDGIIADLGMSSVQVDTAERGFSFARRGPLDMRMDRTQSVTAAHLVNEASEQELTMWFQRYGEERFSGRIARAIVARRATEPFAETADLAETVRKAVPPQFRRGKWRGYGGARGTGFAGPSVAGCRGDGGRAPGRIDAATRVFQALRIVVNGELLHLERFLGAAPAVLKPNGRLAVMSYHSLEDRLVKHRFRELAAAGDYALVTKKPVQATPTEIRKNARARSAKLRVLQRRG